MFQPAEASPGGSLTEPEVRGKLFSLLWTGGGQSMSRGRVELRGAV